METQCAFKPRFTPGIVVVTQGIQSLVEKEEFDPTPYLCRHLCGDWGDASPDDWQANEQALEQGERLLSIYHLSPTMKLWIITEWDRSITTILLADEY